MQVSLKLLALLVALTTTALQARADEEPPTVRKPFYAFFRVTSPSDFRVFINKNSPETLCVELKNAQGEMLYTTHVGKREPGKALTFNLRSQPDGVYILHVRGKNETVTKTFVLSTPAPMPAPERTLALRQ